ncbi:DNA-binding helix-turn-helix protein [Leptospira broomii serovar Hurstbridge str. 5399]|uniref:DNA-binding helix-turn-helix protein n=1 Tax=Leptospira broomii serovar Hurstbridge str. 5399 TaxID=1049789 RepID=T0F798_9LEPT|nr:helix-turn-helix transcriptional regulator [Leptospira broomii]EQA43786.1 DNA-binding helix-turn-helix protein [Leptospira broomii serovar Hurstbridge str. 5399]
MKNSLYIWDCHVLFAAWEETSAMHSLYAASILISVERPARLFLPNEPAIEFTGVFIPPNQMYREMAKQTHVLNLNIDPDSLLFERIAGSLNAGIQVFDSNKIPNLSEIVKKAMSEDTTDAEAFIILQNLVNTIFGSILPYKESKALDNRVMTVVNHLHSLAHIPHPQEIKLGHLAKLVNLSEDRFRHLFKETLFISVRKYLLNLRLKVAAKNMHRCSNLTEAAHIAGFSDSAHFSRTFRTTYGHRPSVVFRKSKRTRIRSIDESLTGI